MRLANTTFRHFLMTALSLLVIWVPLSAPGTGPSHDPRLYPYIVMDDPAVLWTMKQFDQNYLSAYRYGVRAADAHLSPWASTLLQWGLTSFLLMPYTHEEGHRSVLTVEGIGSISRPYWDSRGVAVVYGVTDAQLEALRDTKLPTYIRLHTAGLESDAALLARSETLVAFEQETVDTVWIEYLVRRVNQVVYYASGLYEQEVGIEEEDNELDRDIVGHDVYGAIRHLHRPDMEFYRYTEYADLTREERDFVKQVGIKALLNLVNPLVVRKANFGTESGMKWSFGLGYCLCPFGGFFEENLWVLAGEKRMHFYLRQFENRECLFWGGGVRLQDYPVGNRFLCSVALHAWVQPEELSFTADKGESGGAADLLVRWRAFESRQPGGAKTAFVDLGVTAKTDGFMPEEAFLAERIGVRIGCTFEL